MQLLCYSVAMVPLPPVLLAVAGCCWFYILFRSCHHWCCFFRCWFIFALKMFIDFVVALLLALLLLLGECCIFLQFLLNVSHFLTALHCIASSCITLPVLRHVAFHCIVSCHAPLCCFASDSPMLTAILLLLRAVTASLLLHSKWLILLSHPLLLLLGLPLHCCFLYNQSKAAINHCCKLKKLVK